MKHFILFMLMLFTVSSASAYKKERIYINSGGKQRNMLVFTPDELPEGSPLFIVTHGMGGNSDEQSSRDKMYELIDTAKFVVVYPRANGDYWDISGTSDQKFIISVIDEMAKRHNINRKRVYWSGFSMGSMLIFHCMPNMLDKIAAFAPTSGIQFSEEPWKLCKKKVNVIECIAYGDNAFIYNKYGIHSYMENLANMNQYTKYEKLTGYRPKNGTASFDGDRELWLNENTGHEVVLFSFNYGKSTHTPVAENSYEIWNFCKRFQTGDTILVPPALNVVRAEPENNSFDLPFSMNTFTYEFDRKIDCQKLVATLKADNLETNLELKETGMSNILTLSLPEGITLNAGKHVLTLSSVIDERNIASPNFVYNYYYGFTEVTTDTQGTTPAIVCKKAFLIALANAKSIYAATADSTYTTAKALRTALKSIIDEHASLIATAPSIYDAATKALVDATQPLAVRKTNLDNYFAARSLVKTLIDRYAGEPSVNQSQQFKRLTSHYDYYNLPDKYMVRDAKLITATENLNAAAQQFLEYAATGISSPSATDAQLSVGYYDLRGNKIDNPTKGIYIQKSVNANGSVRIVKKVVRN